MEGLALDTKPLSGTGGDWLSSPRGGGGGGIESPGVQVTVQRSSSAGWHEVQDQGRTIEELQRELEVETRRETATIETQTDPPPEEVPEDCAERWFAGFSQPVRPVEPVLLGDGKPAEGGGDSDSLADGDEAEDEGCGVLELQRQLRHRLPPADEQLAEGVAVNRSRSRSASSESSSASSSSSGESKRQRATSSEEEPDLADPAVAAALAALAGGVPGPAVPGGSAGNAPQGASSATGAAPVVPDPRVRAVPDYSDLS